MADDVGMRARLQEVVAYRELCRGVRRSGRENVLFASLMLYMTYLISENPNVQLLVLIIYGGLAAGELFVGLFKWLNPSAEGVLLDGIVILAFAGLNLLSVAFGPGTPPWVIFLAMLLLANAIGRFQAYAKLRRLFAERPSAEHMAWFDDLEREIRAADPQSDELALDLPTTPHWKVKLLGTMAFFVTVRGSTVWIAGPGDFEILRAKADAGIGRRKALLRVHDYQYPEFEITDATWANYLKWRAANPLASAPVATA